MISSSLTPEVHGLPLRILRRRSSPVLFYRRLAYGTGTLRALRIIFEYHALDFFTYMYLAASSDTILYHT
jgi:hypothetical protein